MAKTQMKGDKRKKTKTRKNTRKVVQNRVFLHFLANHNDEDQTKMFLTRVITDDQLLLLRELVVNDLEGNIPSYSNKKTRNQLRHALKTRLHRFALGELKKQNVHYLYPLLKILAQNALRHHGLNYQTSIGPRG